METEFFDEAEADLDKMDQAQRKLFIKHIEKIANMPPRRHLRFGLPFNVDEIGQGRIAYEIKNDVLYIVRCFTTHKDYEKWFKSFK